MSNHSKALALINQLVEKFGKGGYIFRGTTTVHSDESEDGKIYDGINSTLYRWAMKVGEDEKIPGQQSLYREEFTKNPYFSIAQMEQEIVGKAIGLFPSNTKFHEILTELQHFGGNTNMIDFTRNIYIALFFACQGKFDKPGELIALHKDKLEEIYEINYAQPPKALEIIAPAGAQSSRQRVHFQSSVFVRPANGYINPEKCDITKIPTDAKEPVLEYLRTFHNLTESTIYNDLHGFIKNEKNNETFSLYFYMGLANQNKGDNKKAIYYYSECVEKDPNGALAYNNRGNAYTALHQHTEALRDYNKAISISPNYADAYHNRGNAYIRLQNSDLAFENLNKAISLNPNIPQTYNSRGYLYMEQGQEELAIKDLDKAIELKRDYAEPYFNRGLMKRRRGDKEGAKADFDKARELGFIGPEGEEE